MTGFVTGVLDIAGCVLVLGCGGLSIVSRGWDPVSLNALLLVSFSPFFARAWCWSSCSYCESVVVSVAVSVLCRALCGAVRCCAMLGFLRCVPPSQPGQPPSLGKLFTSCVCPRPRPATPGASRGQRVSRLLT